MPDPSLIPSAIAQMLDVSRTLTASLERLEQVPSDDAAYHAALNDVDTLTRWIADKIQFLKTP